MGHEDAFPRPRLSARCRFSQGTLAGTWVTGETRRFQTFPPLPRKGEVRSFILPFPSGKDAFL